MNLATVLIGLVVAGLLALAIRYLAKNGSCAACEAKGACHAARQGSGDGDCACDSSQCSGCQFYEYELQPSGSKR